jgi:hypothetical protein
MENQIFVACKSGTADGVMRCRFEGKEGGCCALHSGKANVVAAPRPTVVLFKVKLGPKTRSWFAKVEVDYLTKADRRAREAQRVADAEKLGRKAYCSRLKGASDRPEDADSGCPVFGATTGGLKKVDVRNLEAELRQAGFHMAEATVRVTDGQKGQPMNATLVLAFTNDEEEDPDFSSWVEFNRLVAPTFAFVHVWANPKQADGTVVHTVNCLSRQEGAKADYALRYANGDWAAEPIVAS